VRIVDGAPHRVYGPSDVITRLNALSRADFGRSAQLVARNGALRLG
jgi:hypothetical protein